MKKTLISLCAIVLLLSSFGMAGAITFYPVPVDIYDLNHNYYYTWGINWTIDDETIFGVSLTFDNIRDFTNEDNTLFIHLLNTAPEGVTIYNDNTPGIYDDFDGEGILLTQYSLPATAQDITYYFTEAQVDTLKAYLADGNIGLGFDPDCHYYNDGVSLTIVTTPEPTTLLLLGLGLLGLGFVRRTS